MIVPENAVSSLGLDISSTSTGFVSLLGEPNQPSVVLEVGVWTPPAKLDVLDRASWQAEKLLDALSRTPLSHDQTKITIEAVGGGTFPGALIPIVMVTTVLKYFLRQSGYAWQEASNSQLKKFVGAVQKEDIKVAAYKRWSFEHKSNDVVDAYVLAQIGLASAGSSATVLTSFQAEVIKAMAAPKAKKTKKPRTEPCKHLHRC